MHIITPFLGILSTVFKKKKKKATSWHSLKPQIKI